MRIYECESWGKMKNRSLAADQTPCTQRAFKITPKKLYCPIGDIYFAEKVYNTNTIKTL